MPSSTNHRDAAGKILPAEVSAKTGTWFGRAHNYQIFSISWFRYRSLALCTGAIVVVPLLAALAVRPIRYRTLGPVELADAVTVTFDYLVPVLILILAGPALAVGARRTRFGKRHELVAIMLSLILGVLCSIGAEQAHRRYYERRHLDSASGMELRGPFQTCGPASS
jgi:hypothetical protein